MWNDDEVSQKKKKIGNFLGVVILCLGDELPMYIWRKGLI